MGAILDFLSPAWIEHRLEVLGKLIRQVREKEKPESQATLRRVFAKWRDGPGPALVRGSDIDQRMQLASLEYVLGGNAESVRAALREAAAEWEPVIEAMNFRPLVYQGETTSSRAADEMRRTRGATVERRRSSDLGTTVYHYRYKARPQPLEIDVLEKVLPCAAVCGDMRLARRLARAYLVNPPDSSNARFVILRHLLAEDDKAAATAAKKMEGGSMTDFPPEPIEFPLGVVRHDQALLLKGVRRVATAAAPMFREQRYRRGFQRLAARKSRLRPPPTWEQAIESARSALVTRGWLLPVYALAYLNVAAHRGIPLPAGDANRFNEFVPAALSSGHAGL